MDAVATLLIVLSGLLANRILIWFQNLPFLADEEKTKLVGPLADVLAWAFALISGYFISLLSQAFGLTPPGGEVMIALGAVPAAKGWYELQRAVRK